MNGVFDPLSVDLWEHQDESTVAARADQWTADEALAAFRAQYGIRDEDSWYCGIEVWNLPDDPDRVGRRRRAHVVSSDDRRGLL